MFGVEEELHAEAAADIGGDDAHGGGIDAEDHAGHDVADGPAALGVGADGPGAGRGIVIGQTGTGFHRIDHDAVVDHGQAGDLGGGGEQRLGFRFRADFPVEAQIAGCLRPHLHRIRRNRRGEVGDGGQQVVLHHDGFQRIAPGLHGFGHVVRADDLHARRHRRCRQHDRPAQPLIGGRLGGQGADHALAAGPHQQRAAQRMKQLQRVHQREVLAHRFAKADAGIKDDVLRRDSRGQRRIAPRPQPVEHIEHHIAIGRAMVQVVPLSRRVHQHHRHARPRGKFQRARIMAQRRHIVEDMRPRLEPRRHHAPAGRPRLRRGGTRARHTRGEDH